MFFVGNMTIEFEMTGKFSARCVALKEMPVRWKYCHRYYKLTNPRETFQSVIACESRTRYQFYDETDQEKEYKSEYFFKRNSTVIMTYDPWVFQENRYVGFILRRDQWWFWRLEQFDTQFKMLFPGKFVLNVQRTPESLMFCNKNLYKVNDFRCEVKNSFNPTFDKETPHGFVFNGFLYLIDGGLVYVLDEKSVLGANITEPFEVAYSTITFHELFCNYSILPNEAWILIGLLVVILVAICLLFVWAKKPKKKLPSEKVIDDSTRPIASRISGLKALTSVSHSSLSSNDSNLSSSNTSSTSNK